MDFTMFETTLRRTGELIDSIGDADWRRPTPCSEWDLRALVAHVIGTNRWGAAVARGEAPSADAPEASAAAYWASTEAALAAWQQPGARERLVALPMGEVPGSVAMTINFGDNLVHQWDLAAALSRSITLDPAAAAFELEFARGMITPERRAGGGMFDPAVIVPASAPIQ